MPYEPTVIDDNDVYRALACEIVEKRWNARGWVKARRECDRLHEDRILIIEFLERIGRRRAGTDEAKQLSQMTEAIRTGNVQAFCDAIDAALADDEVTDGP